ncbi:peptidoglycan editing factor PgeF [Brevibacillus migulae]|uniref:peptidoglycan editing factor PgeF n=1 Tax=Brevibacillus migulae TaxID=1644114 RepID=UPI00106EFBB4
MEERNVASFVLSESTHTLILDTWEQQFPGLVAGFTLRTGGQSDAPFASQNMGLHVGDDPQRVTENRRLLCERINMPFDVWTCADQVHGKNVQQITRHHAGAGKDRLDDCIQATDGLHTEEHGILLASFYADCVPLYFFDPKSGAIGLAHAGWKGTVARIAKEMIEAFAKRYDSKAEELLVAIGPAIGGCCYEVDDRIIDQVKQTALSWMESVTPLASGKYLLDLPKLNRLVMTECGVPEEHIVSTDLCTSCHTDLFFSHRKEGGKTGRMASFIGWRK